VFTGLYVTEFLNIIMARIRTGASAVTGQRLTAIKDEN
jgi:hypothetical protein